MSIYMKDLKVSVIQWDLKWEDPQANIYEIEKILSSKSIETDILVLPEMFSTGFSMNASKISEAPGGKTEDWMKSTSLKLNCAVAGSIATKIDDRALNRFLFVTPSDTFHYDKRHLFRMANEHKNYKAGNNKFPSFLDNSQRRVAPPRPSIYESIPMKSSSLTKLDRAIQH